MTDQTIPADLSPEDVEHARSYVADFLDARHVSERVLATARVLQALLPPPPRPTLADMTEEERAKYRWMQADVEGDEGRAVIVEFYVMQSHVRLLWPDGVVGMMPWKKVTPRPDLPRMEWPGAGQDGEEAAKVDYVSVAGGRTAYGPWTVARLRKKPAPAPAALPEGWRLADHKKYGRVIVTNTEPNGDGRVYYVLPSADPMGFDWLSCDPDELTYVAGDQGADTVPTNTLDVGSKWIDLDALAEACEESGRDQIVVLDRVGGAYVWSDDAEWWEGSAPPRFAPFTILHAGREAGQ